MIAGWLSQAGVVGWQVFSLVLFFTLFVGMIAWVFRPNGASTYRRDAALPFDDDTQVPGGGTPAHEEYHG